MKKSNIKKRIYQIVGITIYICIILLVGKMTRSFLQEFKYEMGEFNIATLGSFIGAYVVCVLVHELAHLVSFLLMRFPIVAAEICGILLLFSHRKIKVKINFSRIMLGGWILPVVKKNIVSLKQYKHYKRGFSFALIMGPVVSCVLMVFSLLINIKLKNDDIWYRQFFFLLFFFSAGFVISSVLKKGNSCGDIYSFFLIQKRKIFFLVQMCENIDMEKEKNIYKISNYLIKELEKELQFQAKKNSNILEDAIMVSAINIILMRYIICGDIIDSSTKELFEYCINTLETDKIRFMEEECKILFIHLIYYLKYEDDHRWETLIPYAINIFDDDGVNQYYKAQIKQICYLENNLEFLNERENIKTSSFWEIEHLLNIQQQDERNLLKIFCESIN